MISCLRLALGELVHREIRNDPHFIDGVAWAVRGEDWYGKQLGVTGADIRELLGSPEFENLGHSQGGHWLPITRLRLKEDASSQQAPLLLEVFEAAIAQWKKDDEGELRRVMIAMTELLQEAEREEDRVARLASMTASHLAVTAYLESDPQNDRHLEKLAKAWGYHAPFVLRVVVEGWWDFLGTAMESPQMKRAICALPGGSPDFPNLRVIACLPHLGLQKALECLRENAAIFAAAGLADRRMERWWGDLDAALERECYGFHRA